ncbi:MAG: SBBP repeat-containing protein, partial [Bacteroidia bacterium]|nr:SBBP repeat-containing protein [Bacteroidia bacterium]
MKKIILKFTLAFWLSASYLSLLLGAKGLAQNTYFLPRAPFDNYFTLQNGNIRANFASNTFTLDFFQASASKLGTYNSYYSTQVYRLAFELVEANPNAQVVFLEKSIPFVNVYTQGTRAQLATYQRVWIKNVYPKIDLVYSIPSKSPGGSSSKDLVFEYDFVLHPGANPRDIQLKIQGAQEILLSEEEKHQKISFPNGYVVQTKPVAFSVENFELTKYSPFSSAKANLLNANWYYNTETETWSFTLENYDKQKTLIIDPILWASFLGGSQPDNAEAVATDLVGANYITGTTYSNDINILPGAWQPIHKGNAEAWVAKFNKCGQLLWITYLGGNEDDFGTTIAVNSNGEVYVGGTTFSSNFPYTNDSSKYTQSFQGVNGIYSDGFITKLDTDGALLWSTYLGGGGNSFDEVLKIAISPDNKVACVGFTTSTSFPITNNPGQYNQPFGGNTGDGFLFLLDDQDNLLWSTYVGGTDQDRVNSVAFSSTGNLIYLAGTTFSLDFPITQNAGQYYQAYSGSGASEAFIMQFTSSGIYNWGCFYGGSSDEVVTDIKVAPNNTVCIIGATASNDFPITQNTNQYSQALAGFWDAMVLSFNSTGALLWATALGGSTGSDLLESLQYMPPNYWLAVGKTSSLDIPLQSGGPFQNTTLAGAEDILLTRFHVSTGSLSWSTYLGSTGLDFAKGITIDDCHNAVLVAGSSSSNLPLLQQPGQFMQSFAGISDAYIIKFGDSLVCSLPPAPPTAIAYARCGPGPVTITAFMGNPAGSTIMLYDSPFSSTVITFTNAAPYQLITPDITGPTTFYLQTVDVLTDCYSPTRTSLEVNISPIPSPPTASSINLCASSVATFTATMGLVPGTTIYLYTQEQATQAIDSTSNAPYLLTTPVVTTLTTFYLSTRLGYCESSTRTPVFVQVTTTPATPSVENTNVTICGSGNVTFSVTMGNPSGDEVHLYTQEQGGQPIAVGINELTTTLMAGETQDFWIGSYFSQSGCSSTSRMKVTATAINPPAPPIAQNISRCGAGKVSISAFMNIPPGDEVLLYATPFGGEPLAVDATSPYVFETPELTTTTTFFLSTRYSANGCASTTRTPVVVQLSEGPTPPIVENIQRCETGLVTFTALGVPQGHFVRVYTQSEGTRPVATLEREPFLFSTAANQTITYYFVSVDSRTGCESLVRSAASVTIFSAQEPFINTKELTRCGSGKISFSVQIPNPSVGTEVRLLQDPLGTVLSSAVTEPFVLITPILTSSTTYYVQVINQQTRCTTLKPVFFQIVNKPNPPIVQNIRLCGAAQTIITVLPNNALAPEIRMYESMQDAEPLDTRPMAPYLFPIYNITTTTTYHFSAAYGNCESERVPLRIEVIHLSIPQINSITTCGGGIVTLTANMGSPAGTEIRLYDAPQDGQLMAVSSSAPYTFTLNNITTHTTFYASVFHSGLGCESDRKPASITVLPLPNIEVSSNQVHRCGAGNISFSISASPNTLIRLYSQRSGGEPLQESLGPSHTFILNNLTTTTRFWLEAINTQSGCSTRERTLLTVYIHERPAPPTATSILTRCGSGSITITALQGRPGGTAIELLSQNQEVLQSQRANFAIFETSVATTTTFYLRTSNDGCFSESIPIIARVLQRPPKPQVIVSPVQLCGPGNVSFALPPNFEADTVKAYSSYLGNTVIAQLYRGATNVEIAISQSTTFYFVQTNNLCPSDTLAVPIVVAPRVMTPMVQSVSICQGSKALLNILNATGKKVRILDINLFSVDSVVCLSACSWQTPFLNTTTTFYFESIDIASNCVSPRVSSRIEVLSTPAAPKVAPVSICQASMVTLTIQQEGAGGQAIALYTTPVANEPFATAGGNPALITTPYITTTTTFFVQSFNFQNNCKSERVPVIITLENNLPVPIVNRLQACAGSIVTFTILPSAALPANTIARVFLSANATTPIASLSSLPFQFVTTATFPTTFYFDFFETTRQCNSSRIAANIDVFPTPSAPSPLSLSSCNTSISHTFLINDPNFEIVLYADAHSSAPLQVLPPNNLTYTFSQSQNIYYSLRNRQNGCESSRSPLNIEILSTPLPPVLPNSLIGICEGASQYFLQGVQTDPSVQGVRLYTQSIGGFPIAEDNSQPFSFLLPIPTGTTLADYYLESFNRNCVSNTRTKVTLFIDPTQKPAPPIVSPVTRCGMGVVTFSPLAGGAVNEVFLFESAQAALPLASSSTLPFTLTTPPITQTTTFYIAASSSGCQSQRIAVSAIVQRMPLSPAVSYLSRCGAGIVEFTVNNALANDRILLFTQPNGGIPILETLGGAMNVSVTTTVTYYLQAINVEAPQCTTQRVPFSIIVTPPPVTPIIAPQTICQGNSLSIPLPPQPNGVALNIYHNQNKIATITQNPWLWHVGLVSTTTTYLVEAVQANCAGEKQPFVVAVAPPPRPPLVNSSNLSHCGAAAFTLEATHSSASATSFRIYNFSQQLIFQTTQTPLAWNTSTVTTSTTYYISSFDAQLQCESEKVGVAITILEVPMLSLPVRQVVCQGKDISYTAPGNFAQYTWRGPNNYFSSNPVLFLQNAQPLQAGIYTLEVRAANGCVATSTTEIFVTPLPSAPQIPTTTLCQGGVATIRPIFLPPSTEVLRVFNLAQGGVEIAQRRTSPFEVILPFINATTTFYAEVEVNGCSSLRTPFVVTVELPTTFSITPSPLQRCGAGTVTFTVVSTNGSQARLYAIPGSQPLAAVSGGPSFVFQNWGMVNQTTTYYVEVISSNNCPSTLMPLPIQILPLPLTPTVTNYDICGARQLTITIAYPNSVNTTLHLYSTASAITPLQSILSPYVLTLGTLSSNTTFWLSAKDNQTGCESNRVSFSVNVLPVPGAPSVLPQTVCQGQSLHFSVQTASPTPSHIHLWQSDNAQSPLQTLTTFPYLFSISNANPSLTYYLQSQLGSCFSERVVVPIRFLPTPTLEVVTPVTRCGQGKVNITATASPLGTIVRLYSSQQDNNPIATAHTAPYILETPTVSGNTFFFVEAELGICKSQRVPVAIQVLSQPQQPILQAPAWICGVSEVNIQAFINEPGTTVELWQENPRQLIESQVVSGLNRFS